MHEKVFSIQIFQYFSQTVLRFVHFSAFHYMLIFYLIIADLKPLLTSEIVTELVMTNIDNLPRKMPKTFYNSYTPIARAGTEAQVINSHSHSFFQMLSKSVLYSRCHI